MFRVAGAEAADILTLFWVMTVLFTLVFAGVMTLMVFARSHEGLRRHLSRERIVIGGGIFFPVVVLSLLFVYSLLIMPVRSVGEHGPPALRIAISGEQWWWRVTYHLADGSSFESANELRLPVGQPVALELTTADVIHSFWVPSLAGKVDMIPGRTNHLTVMATEAGVSRGQCAEYCGGAHAFMSFYAVALAPQEFTTWLVTEAADAVPASDEDMEGARLFRTIGCGGCHTIRGTENPGIIGPDLTHVGSRLSLGAATLPNDEEAFVRWIRDNPHVKPDNLMPAYDILSADELSALARYLDRLD